MLTASPRIWSTSIGSMAIGHGISVTPVQMAMAFNAIANERDTRALADKAIRFYGG